MSCIPSDFRARLHREFDGRLRVRWSDRQQEYQVEQKVSRPMGGNVDARSGSDEHVRLRDGYHYILSVQPGTRMGCPKCRTTLKVPAFEIRQVSCPLCKVSGREHRVAGGYFPLNDQLIDYLKQLDPNRDGVQRSRSRVDANNLKLVQQQQRQVLNATTDAASDDFNRIAGIPSVGYTGKIFQG